MRRVWQGCQRELLFLVRFVVCLLLLAGLIAAIGYSQNVLLVSENCSEESPAAPYWFCVETGPPLKTYLANDTVYQQGGGGGSTPTPSMEATRAVNSHITGGITLATAVNICRTETSTCTDAVRIVPRCDVGNICRIEFYSAANALITESKAVYSGSSWITSIDTAGTQTTCVTMDDAGLITYAANESCGRLSGLVHLEFSEDDGTHTCGAGNFGIWADDSDDKLKACQNGSLLDLIGTGGAGPGDIEKVGGCVAGECFQSETATHAFMGGTPAAFRALADADIPDSITLDGNTVNGTLTYGTGGKPLIPMHFDAAALDVDGTNCTLNMVAIASFPQQPVIACADNDNGRMVFRLPRSSGQWDAGTINVVLTGVSITNQNGLTAVWDMQVVCTGSGEQVATAPATGTTNTATLTWGNQTNDLRHSNTVAIATSGCAATEMLTLIMDYEDSATGTLSTTTGVLLGGIVVWRPASSN